MISDFITGLQNSRHHEQDIRTACIAKHNYCSSINLFFLRTDTRPCKRPAAGSSPQSLQRSQTLERKTAPKAQNVLWEFIQLVRAADPSMLWEASEVSVAANTWPGSCFQLLCSGSHVNIGKWMQLFNTCFKLLHLLELFFFSPGKSPIVTNNT